jgi:hypothetical protein
MRRKTNRRKKNFANKFALERRSEVDSNEYDELRFTSQQQQGLGAHTITHNENYSSNRQHIIDPSFQGVYGLHRDRQARELVLMAGLNNTGRLQTSYQGTNGHFYSCSLQIGQQRTQQ